MSIDKIKETATLLKEGRLLGFLKTSGAFGIDNPYKELRSLFELIEAYKEPNPEVDAPPKPKSTRRTRRTVKNEESVE